MDLPEELTRQLQLKEQELRLKQSEIAILKTQVAYYQRVGQYWHQEAELLKTKLTLWEQRWTQLQQSLGGKLLKQLQLFRATVAPPHSVRDQTLQDVLVAWQTKDVKPLHQLRQRVTKDVKHHTKLWRWQMQLRLATRQSQTLQVKPLQPRPIPAPHQATIDIIVCVHNALADVQRCVESVLAHSQQPYHLILVDDGSDAPTQNYLTDFAKTHPITLLRHEQARGYTKAANQGLRQSTADMVILLNSDTIVTPQWLDRLAACAESQPQIGLVGPLANTASWQSIPFVETNQDWADNPLPEGVTIEVMAEWVARHSARLYPTMPFLNGFCLLIKRAVLQQVGYFDEETFGAGYGEENDYALRVRQAGWQLVLADDCYIYHAQSRSYSHERRKLLAQQADTNLARKHGTALISAGVAWCRSAPVLQGIRARSRVMAERQRYIAEGCQRFMAKRVLFVLPITEPGGGGNVIIDEARSMQQMGVTVHIFNLGLNRSYFERAYPDLDIPVIYGDKMDLPALARDYDAMIATVNYTVEWLDFDISLFPQLKRGYYVQDFEPFVYEANSFYYERALKSYTLFPDLICFTKTNWNYQIVHEQTGQMCHLVGISFNLDLFRPQPQPESPRPLRIVGMVRPRTPYRAPKLTMELLQRAQQKYGYHVEIVIFGVELSDSSFLDLPRDFAWRTAGILTPAQMATLLNEADIFVDFSTHQAMGLTALEAMSCGVAVIVPEQGGAPSFARHEQNSLVVDTQSAEACWSALQRLIDDATLRERLRQQAMQDVVEFFPERTAFNILQCLFAA